MASRQRHKTKYSGIFYQIDRSGKKVFFLRYKLPENQRLIEERAGSEIHGMTAAKANLVRAERLAGKSIPNQERKQKEKTKKTIEEWSLRKLWETYVEIRSSASFDLDTFSKDAAAIFSESLALSARS